MGIVRKWGFRYDLCQMVLRVNIQRGNMKLTIKEIQEAVERYRTEFEHGESAWITVPHWWYPWGLDVQIELEDDKESPNYDKVTAWVYPNIQREECAYLETDIESLLDVIPLE